MYDISMSALKYISLRLFSIIDGFQDFTLNESYYIHIEIVPVSIL